MKIVNSQHSILNKDTIATIGTFDGVHIGHQKILKSLINIAKENELESVVLTFFPHPRMVLQKDSGIKLTTLYAEPAIGGNTPRLSPFDTNFKEDIMASGR